MLIINVKKGNLIYLLCEQKELNVELIRYFIDHGAIVNKGNKSTLTALCQQNDIIVELIKFFIENGSDVNKGNQYNTPLATLCHKKELNVELIQYFLTMALILTKEIPFMNYIDKMLFLFRMLLMPKVRPLKMKFF